MKTRAIAVMGGTTHGSVTATIVVILSLTMLSYSGKINLVLTA